MTMEAVGGRSAVEAELDAIVRSPHVDVLVSWAINAAPSEEAFADDLVIKGFEHAGYATAFRSASDALIASEAIRSRVGAKLTKALEARAGLRNDSRNGLIAAYALETWLRLALNEVVQRHRLISVLVEVQPDENGLFLEHAAKIVGAAFHAWRETDLLPVLERLRKNQTASGEATFEYGNALLVIALEGNDQEEVMGGLEAAGTLFAEAVRSDPDRSDAQVYAAVIEVARGFSRGADETDLRLAVNSLEAAAADRTFLLSAGRLPDWLAPRRDKDVQWLELLDAIPRLATDLERPSWLHACEVLDRLLRVYDADRTIADGAAFGVLIRPRIEASFIRERGLLAHLDDRLRDDEFVGEDRTAAAALRERIEEMAAEPNPPGKSREGAYTEKLRGALEDIGAPKQLIERLITAAEGKLYLYDELANPVIQRVYADIRSQLRGGIYYKGEVRKTFDRLLLQIILFCMDRQDAAKKELGERGDYLFTKNPVEGDLQKDLRGFLVGNLIGSALHTELEGIAKGRCDIYVGHGGWRFLIELKKHEGQVTKQVARSYVGQAASYQGTNVKLGMLGILELVNRTGPPPGLEDCIWFDSLIPDGDTTVRHLVVFKIPGRMKRPSELSR
ncbi:hypothetical protein [Methylobacterium mesophilicum]|uniref:hypothetical protein n=1 Tax=Methylobacterium mesophilicum TaxID=39956 RepID=UPI00361CCE76